MHIQSKLSWAHSSYVLGCASRTVGLVVSSISLKRSMRKKV